MCLVKNYEERATIKDVMAIIKIKGQEMSEHMPIKLGAKVYRPESTQVLILSIYYRRRNEIARPRTA
jgi:hypothetical protein